MKSRLNQLIATALVILFASFSFVQNTSAQSNTIQLSTVNLCINFGASCPDSDTLSVDIPEGDRISAAEARWISTGHFQPNEYSSVPTDNGTVSGHTYSATTGDIKALPLKGMTGSFELTVVHDGRLDLLPPGSLDQAGSHRVDIYITLEAISTPTPTATATSTPTPTLPADRTASATASADCAGVITTTRISVDHQETALEPEFINLNNGTVKFVQKWSDSNQVLTLIIPITPASECGGTSTPTPTLPADRTASATASADCAGVITTTRTSVDSAETALEAEFAAQNGDTVLFTQRWSDSTQVLKQVISVTKAENCAPPNTPREIVRAADIGMVPSCAGLTTGVTNIRNLRPGYLTDDVNSIVSPVWAGKKSIEEQTMFTPWSDARDYSWDIPSEGKTITIHGIRIRTVMVYSEDFGLPSPRTQERILMPFAVPSLEWFQANGCIEQPTTTITEDTHENEQIVNEDDANVITAPACTANSCDIKTAGIETRLPRTGEEDNGNLPLLLAAFAIFAIIVGLLLSSKTIINR